MNAFPQLRMPAVRSAPGRQFITSDPSKLTFFAQANGARFNVTNTAGALRGLSGLGTTLDLPPVDLNGGSPNGVKTGTDIATVAGSFINSLIGTKTPDLVAPAYVAPVDDTILGLPKWLVIGAGVAVAGAVGYKLYKKR